MGQFLTSSSVGRTLLHFKDKLRQSEAMQHLSWKTKHQGEGVGASPVCHLYKRHFSSHFQDCFVSGVVSFSSIIDCHIVIHFCVVLKVLGKIEIMETICTPLLLQIEKNVKILKKKLKK